MSTDNAPQIRFLIAENRTVYTAVNYTTYHTSVKGLIDITEIELNAQTSIKLGLNSTAVLLMPIIGACQVETGMKESVSLHSEELLVLDNSNSSRAVSITNPHRETVKILVIASDYFYSDKPFQKDSLRELQLNYRNQLVSPRELPFIKIGVFDSRFKGTYTLGDNSALVSFTINGTFEFEERMLNQKDCLYLNGVKTVDFESLTEFAILLIVDIHNQRA